MKKNILKIGLFSVLIVMIFASANINAISLQENLIEKQDITDFDDFSTKPAAHLSCTVRGYLTSKIGIMHSFNGVTISCTTGTYLYQNCAVFMIGKTNEDINNFEYEANCFLALVI